MIGFITVHYKDKREFEQFVLKEKKFKSKLYKKDLCSENFIYPLEAKYQGMCYKIDEYKGYLYGNIRFFYSEEKGVKYTSVFGYSNLCESIDLLAKQTVQIDSTTLSRLTIVFKIYIPISGEEMIKNNIIMYKLLGYNHNLSEDLKKGIKVFEYHNYKFCFISEVSKGNKNKKSLTVRLEFKTSADLRKLGLNNIKDLKDKLKLKGLFDIFLKMFNGLTIIDGIQESDVFSERDKQKLITYMNPSFWNNLLIRNKRTTKYLAKKDFEKLQKEYKLNTLRDLLREKIIIEFDSFINN
jgi:hypothetical protein